MKKVMILGLVVLLYIAYQLGKEPPQSSNEPIAREYHPDVIGYDWERNINVTKRMADTMHLISGKWWGDKEKANYERPRTYSYRFNNEPKWIRPAGNEYNLRTPNGKGTEQLWRMENDRRYREAHQEKGVSEDRVREIINEEKDY